MELPGKKVSYEPQLWPYKGEINTAAIQQQLHFPIDTRHMTSMYRTLADFDKSSPNPLTSTIVLQLIAEAVTNTVRFRGSHAGTAWLGENPRVTVLLTYITRDLWENEEDRIGLLEMKHLLREDNVVGMMFSVFLMDAELDFSDAVSDQMKINVFGPPKFRKKKFGGNNNGDGDSDDEDDAMDVDGGRPDVPGRKLDDRGSKYYFEKNRDGSSRLEPRERFDTSLNNLYRRVNSNVAYVRLACMFTAGLRDSMDALTRKSDDYTLSQLPHDSPFRPNYTFSLDAALDKFRQWGANPVFCRRDSWINTWRTGDDHAETFGAPFWRAGAGYAQGSAACMAYYPLEHFNARDLMEYCLPHIELTDQQLIQPGSKRAKTVVDADGDQFVLEDYLHSLGIKTMAEQIRDRKDGNINQDIFNDYFSKFAEVAARIDEMLDNTDEPSPDYIEQLRRLQSQGFSWYNSVMDPNNAKLPEGYQALQLFIWERTDWTPSYDRMWQTGGVAMTPFAQMKVRDLVFDDELVKVADNTLLLKSRMMRSIYTIYIPTIGKVQNKEHSQYVGTPGTSKSHSLTSIVNLLIPDTWEQKSGGSMMGMIGAMKSERMLTLYQELPNLLAPDGDYKGDADKHLRMKLTQLGDGITEYSTTREVTMANGDKTREGVSTTAAYTNVVLGARNVKAVNATAGGAVEAMYDRFTIIQQRQILAPGRVNLINRVLEASRKEMSSGLVKLQGQYQLIHRAIMEYGALMSCYAVPLPDLSLFTRLAPLAVGYLAQLRPELHFQLRNISRIKTRMYVEVILHAIRLALTTPLNTTKEPTAHNGVPGLKFAAYDTQEAMVEIQRYAYSTLDQIVFVLTEAMYELTTAESFAITQAFTEKYSDYYAEGRRAADHKPADQRPRWPGPAPGQQPAANHPHMEEIAQLAPRNAGVDDFITKLNNEGIYTLGMPTQAHISRMRNSVGKHGREAQYSEYELTSVEIEDEYEELFMLNAKATQNFFKLERAAEPKYKREYRGNGEYINPNYVTIKSDINGFAHLVAGRVGDYQLNEATVKELLYDLRRKTIVTPYMPSIEAGGKLRTQTLNEIQSLRYIREAMKRFPKYKVPVLINNPHEGEFYVLVSYFETNPYEVVNNMVKHICYESTFRRRSIMGIPSQAHCLHYEPVEIRPEAGKKLVVARKSNINKATYRLLQDYTDNVLDDADHHDEVWFKEDMEEYYAMEFLKRYNPSVDRATLIKYTPRGIWAELYGPQGHYRSQQAKEENLLSEPYPEVFTRQAEEEESPPVQRARPMSYPAEPVVQVGKRKDHVDEAEQLAKRTKASDEANIGDASHEDFDFSLM